MLYTDLHIRSFTPDEFLTQVRLGNFEMSPAVCEAIIQNVALYMNDYAEMEDAMEDMVDRDDYDDVCGQLDDAESEIDNLEDELNSATQQVESLEDDVSRRDSIITNLVDIIVSAGLESKISRHDKALILNEVLCRDTLE